MLSIDKQEINIQGRVSILINNKVIFNKTNNITNDSLQIIMRCLAGIPNNPTIDTIKAQGDFGDVNLNIFDSVYDISEGNITFIATAFENSFDGNLTDLKLHSSLLGLNLAEKTDLNIYKDDSTRLEIRWSIKITNC